MAPQSLRSGGILGVFPRDFPGSLGVTGGKEAFDWTVRRCHAMTLLWQNTKSKSIKEQHIG